MIIQENRISFIIIRENKNEKIEFHALIYALSSKKIKNKIAYIQTCIFIQNNKKIKFHAF